MENREAKQTAICVDRVVKTYGSLRALAGASFSALAGETTIVFGANGAGKSTILRIIAGLIRPDSGTVTVNGFDSLKQGPQARSQMGATLHSPMLYADLTLRENLILVAKLFRLQNPEEISRAVAEQLKIADKLDERVRRLSRGMTQRAAVARAIMHNPKVLVLDEPETGLDAESIQVLDQILEEQKSRGGATLMTTHLIEHGLEVADSIVVMRRGRVVLHDKRGSYEQNQIRELQ